MSNEERMFPHNLEAEKGVLGSIIIDPEALVEVADFLRAEDFYRDAHRTLYEVVLDLYNRRDPADFITICNVLSRGNLLENVGGPGYITSLINYVPTSGNARYYGQIVERTAILRRLIHAAGVIATEAYQAQDEHAKAMVDHAEQLVFEIGQRANSQGDDLSISEVMTQYMAKLEELSGRRGTLVGVPSGFTDLDRLTGGFRRSDVIVLAARPSVGKCLPAWTLIDDPETGERLTIEACIQRRLCFVHGLSEDGRVRVTPISHWIDSGIKPCYRVQTSLGRMVEVTGHHPFLTVEGWKPLCELQVGNFIAVPTKVECFGKDEDIPLEKVRLLAYFLAEGCLTSDSPKFTNVDPVIIEDFRNCIATQFPSCVIRQYRIDYVVVQPFEGAIRDHLGRLPKNPVVSWLRDVGLMGKRAKEKFFPVCVWKWSRRYLAEFICALMSCDGCVYPVSNGSPRLEFSVASQQLARDLQHALTRFGIIAKVSKKVATCQGKSFDAWCVYVSHPESIKRYQEEVGWIGEKKTRFADYVRKVLKEDDGNKGHAPKEVWMLVRAAAQRQRLSLIELARRSGETTKTGHRAGYNSHTKRNLPRYRLSAYAQVLDDMNLQRIASPDVYWDEIVAIEAIGEQHVYDLSVPDGENFVAQDVFVHNTSCALSMVHLAATRYQKRIGIFSLEMSSEQLGERLLAIETGINLQRLNTGDIEDDEWERVIGAIGRISELPIRLDGTSVMSPIQMRSRARKWMVEHGLDLIVIDYLQLMQESETTGRKQTNRVQMIDEISRHLKMLARELNIPILVLAQLSRAVEQRMSKVPQLSDLRESGAIEMNADMVIFIYRDEMYHPDSERKGYADLIVAKHRNGPTGQIVLKFEAKTTRFLDPVEPLPPALSVPSDEEIDLDEDL